MDKKVYIVILNWNGWRDTIECLESIFELDYSNYRVVVCDNGSTDSSLKYLADWAKGDLVLDPLKERPIAIKSTTSKPLAYSVHQYSENQLRNTENIGNQVLSFISIGKNYGFAGGINVGIQYSIKDPECSYIWVLNNDTLVTPAALSSLVARMTEDPEIGICGSTLLYYQRPDTVQALGGARYYKCFAYAKHIGAHSSASEVRYLHNLEKKMSYVVGASMMITRRVINDIGLMNEEYFLYCEEMDYCLRASAICKLGYSSNSIVYHKEGASTGGSTVGRKKKSLVSLYYAVRSRILFTRKYYPWCLPTVYLVTLLRVILLTLRGEWISAKLVLSIFLNSKNSVNGMPHTEI